MAQITHGTGLVWIGSSPNCTSLGLADFSGKIAGVYVTTQSGVDSSDPLRAEFGTAFTDIQCGVSYLVYSNSDGLPYEIEGGIPSDLSTDMGRVGLSEGIADEFLVSALLGDYASANGTYLMTTSFLNNRPTYKNTNGWYAIYNGDDTWSLKDAKVGHTKELKNNNNNPSMGSYMVVDVGPPPPGPTPSPTPVDTVSLESDLVGRWDAQYSSTDVYVEDLIGGYNFLAPSATLRADLSTENRGKVFTFSQTSHYCQIGDILNETFATANFSISLWCNPNSKGALDQSSCCYLSDGGCLSSCNKGILASKWHSSSAGPDPAILKNSWLIYTDGAFISDGSLISDPQSTRITKDIPVNSDEWTHLVYSIKDGLATVYMNGEDVTHPSSANVLHSFDHDCTRPIVLGNIQTTNGYPGDYGYWGSLDDFRIYDGPLSAEDASTIYNSRDEESQSQPFSIPVVEAVETTLPMSDGIEVTEGFDIMLDPWVYGMSAIGDEVAVVAPRSSDGGETWTPVVRFYKRRDWPPTDPFDNYGRYLLTEPEDAYVDISGVVSEGSLVKYFKWIKTETPSRDIFIIWTEGSALQIFRKTSAGTWASGRIGVNWTSPHDKVEYVNYDDPSVPQSTANDTIVIFNSGHISSYRKDSFGLWTLVGQENDVENMVVVEKRMVLSRSGPINSDTFNLTLYDITDHTWIPGASSAVYPIRQHTYQGSYDSKDAGLTIHGDEVYATFTGTQNQRFQFDPSDNYLPNASPNTVYRFDSVEPSPYEIFPPHRLSGIDYNHIHNFGQGIYVTDKYMVITNNMCNFAYLYAKLDSGDWEFVSRLVFEFESFPYHVTSPTPGCHIGDDYCLIHCGNETLDRLIYFKLGDSLLKTDETLPIVSDDLVAWWDFGSTYGRLTSYSHVVFDKSGHNTHLGIGVSYDSLATHEIPGAINNGKVYKFDGVFPVHPYCKSPISDSVFEGEFTVSVWFYRTGDSNRAVVCKAETLGGDDFQSNRTFVIYANGNMYMGSDGKHLPPSEVKSNEWTFLTLVRGTSTMKSYINGQLSKVSTLSTIGHTNNDLQVAPQGDIGYIDDIKIYKKALTDEEVSAEFEKSYRHEFLTR